MNTPPEDRLTAWVVLYVGLMGSIVGLLSLSFNRTPIARAIGALLVLLALAMIPLAVVLLLRAKRK